MEFISKALFWVANSLLVPDIILLLLLFIRSIIMLGELYSQFRTKRKYDRIFSQPIKELSLETTGALFGLLPQKDNTLFTNYLRELLSASPSPDYSDYLLNSFENRVERELLFPGLMSKVGPMLGLMGTLIAMSPALVGLSQGDITGMAYNMQIVFATTVVGIVIALVGILTTSLKQRWYANDLNRLEYVASILDQQAKQ
ncbi:MotA/TolQ/ExbB proton channel family protein [Porphyromonas levii]|uniref:MotA/TolQ/ExbB proton channel family protein n=1 Tax=Porphyromonas levii TaxID=28114 RepID=UPI00035F9CCB|nr:MotA/TolQ/ExbB proton channel family protein [Porphyromonas levii]